MNHWTHFITEDDITNTVNTVAPEQWEVEEAWEAERVALCNADNDAEKAKLEVFHFSFNNPEALRSEIIEMLAEEDEDIAIAEALEREARRAEHEGLSVCGDDEWARR